MRKLATIFAGFAFLGAPTLGQSLQPQVVVLNPDADDEEAIVIPAGSPVRLAAFPRDFDSTATFTGSFTLSGTFEVTGYGEDASATLWPDNKSQEALPYWRVRGGPREIYISNPWAFAQAVIPKDKLEALKGEDRPPLRGHATIIADDYLATIECDAANFAARFVSVVTPDVQMAANPPEEEGC